MCADIGKIHISYILKHFKWIPQFKYNIGILDIEYL